MQVDHRLVLSTYSLGADGSPQVAHFKARKSLRKYPSVAACLEGEASLKGALHKYEGAPVQAPMESLPARQWRLLQAQGKVVGGFEDAAAAASSSALAPESASVGEAGAADGTSQAELMAEPLQRALEYGELILQQADALVLEFLTKAVSLAGGSEVHGLEWLRRVAQGSTLLTLLLPMALVRLER